VEEGEDFSDWSEAEPDNADDDLDSISSTDELLAHILTTNHQPSSATVSSDAADQDEDVIEHSFNKNVTDEK
jgi:hypothetical protein